MNYIIHDYLLLLLFLYQFSHFKEADRIQPLRCVIRLKQETATCFFILILNNMHPNGLTCVLHFKVVKNVGGDECTPVIK